MILFYFVPHNLYFHVDLSDRFSRRRRLIALTDQAMSKLAHTTIITFCLLYIYTCTRSDPPANDGLLLFFFFRLWLSSIEYRQVNSQYPIACCARRVNYVIKYYTLFKTLSLCF